VDRARCHQLQGHLYVEETGERRIGRKIHDNKPQPFQLGLQQLQPLEQQSMAALVVAVAELRSKGRNTERWWLDGSSIAIWVLDLLLLETAQSIWNVRTNGCFYSTQASVETIKLGM
jgi:hypothetical protein